jgi:hypothetical protein
MEFLKKTNFAETRGDFKISLSPTTHVESMVEMRITRGKKVAGTVGGFFILEGGKWKFRITNVQGAQYTDQTHKARSDLIRELNKEFNGDWELFALKRLVKLIPKSVKIIPDAPHPQMEGPLASRGILDRVVRKNKALFERAGIIS